MRAACCNLPYLIVTLRLWWSLWDAVGKFRGAVVAIEAHPSIATVFGNVEVEARPASKARLVLAWHVA